jgi:hypothetical protein
LRLESFRPRGIRERVHQPAPGVVRLEDLPLAVIARAVAGTPPEEVIAVYERSRER